jgi:flagellar secretion chaperone FliS
MSADARSAYLEMQVLTAPPQKLRLMLIDGALRYARQAHEGLTSGEVEGASTALSRARDFVSELLVTIRPEPQLLNQNVQNLYAYVFREIAEAQLLASPERLANAIRVLEEEQVTWQQVCELLGHQPPSGETESNVPAPGGFTLDA